MRRRSSLAEKVGLFKQMQSEPAKASWAPASTVGGALGQTGDQKVPKGQRVILGEKVRLRKSDLPSVLSDFVPEMGANKAEDIAKKASALAEYIANADERAKDDGMDVDITLAKDPEQSKYSDGVAGYADFSAGLGKIARSVLISLVASGTVVFLHYRVIVSLPRPFLLCVTRCR